MKIPSMIQAAMILCGIAILLSALTSCSGTQVGVTGYYETETAGRVEVTYRLPNRVIQPTK